MFTRITEVTVDTTKLNDVRQALDNTVIPTLQSQPGFVDAIESLDPATGELVCLSLWKTREDADRFQNNVFPQLAEGLQPLAIEPPRTRTLEVQTSTVHKIAASKAA